MSRHCYNTFHLCWDWLYTSEAKSDILCNVYEANWRKGSLLFILSLKDADGAVRGHGGGTKDQILIMPDSG